VDGSCSLRRRQAGCGVRPKHVRSSGSIAMVLVSALFPPDTFVCIKLLYVEDQLLRAPERRRLSGNSCKYGLWSISEQLERNATECRFVPSIFLLFKKKLDRRVKISFHRARLSRISAITRSLFDYPTVLTAVYTSLLSTLIRIIIWSQLSDTF